MDSLTNLTSNKLVGMQRREAGPPLQWPALVECVITRSQPTQG